MPAASTLNLDDAQVPAPIIRSYVPMMVDGNKITFIKRDNQTPLKDEIVMIDYSAPNGQRSTHKVIATLALPEALSSTDSFGNSEWSLARTCRVKVEFILPGDSSQTERQHLVALTKSLLADADFSAVVEDLDLIY